MITIMKKVNKESYFYALSYPRISNEEVTDEVIDGKQSSCLATS